MHVAQWSSAGGESSPAVVLLHGLGVSSRYFTPLGMLLGRDAPVLAPDLPGFGRSPGPPSALNVLQLAEATHECLNRFGIGPVTLVGHSLGAQVAVELVLGAPGLVEHLVLIGPTTDCDAASVPAQLLRLLRDLRHEPPRTFALTASDYMRAGPRRIVATMGYAVRHPMLERAARVSVPTSIVRGSSDPIAPAGWIRALSMSMPVCTSITVDRAAHAVHISQAPAVARAVLAARSS